MNASVARLNLSRARVLAVDDSAPAMDIIAQILMGFAVKTIRRATGVDEAQEVLGKETFDLIIIDEQMPGEDGFDLLGWVRATPSGRNYTAPIILASGNPTAATTFRARNLGANFVIAKPLSPGVLLSRIQWIARNSRPFVTSDGYKGPDRRFKNLPPPPGVEERRAEALQLMAAPERALSQDEVNSLFD